jgi:hypothetical protein
MGQGIQSKPTKGINIKNVGRSVDLEHGRNYLITIY